MKDLQKAGFENRGGKGSHRNYVHPATGVSITISGKKSADAKPYQEKAVALGIAGVRE